VGAPFVWFDLTAGDGGRVVSQAATGPAGTSVVVADPGDGLVALFVPAG
jgi:hypothetical protein